MEVKPTHNRNGFSLAWLGAKYWPLWLLFLLWRLLLLLPWRLRLHVGSLLGAGTRLLTKKRRRIVRANLRACKPQLGDISGLERRHFRSLGMGFVESATAWWGNPPALFQKYPCEVVGREIMDDLQRQNRGILLLPMHSTFIELLPAIIDLQQPITQVPRPHNNPLYNHMMRQGRQRRVADEATREGPWGMLEVLRRGGICIYFADHDYGIKSARFEPFFGIPAATTLLGRRMAQRAGAAAVLLEMRRNGPRYFAQFHLFDEYLQAENDEQATRLLHEQFETFVRRSPEQWLWSHRRFKTRPPGAEHIYPGSLAKR